jgi:hypothetical protein
MVGFARNGSSTAHRLTTANLTRSGLPVNPFCVADDLP